MMTIIQKSPRSGFGKDERLLVYRPEDETPDFGLQVLNTLRHQDLFQSQPLRSEYLPNLLLHHFPEETSQKDASAPCELYTGSKSSMGMAPDTLLLDCPNGLGTPFGHAFSDWGYRIDMKQNHLDVLRGYQTEIPTQTLASRMSAEEQNHVMSSLHAGNTTCFPNHVVQSYDLQDLPSNHRFLYELEASRILY